MGRFIVDRGGGGGGGGRGRAPPTVVRMQVVELGHCTRMWVGGGGADSYAAVAGCGLA